MEVYGVIYTIIDGTNDMEYIGQTTRSVEKRFKEHASEDTYIGRAIRSHGAENFVVAVLKVCHSRDELNSCEKHFIKSRNSLSPNGYNCTEGGEGVSGWKHTDEAKASMSLKRKGVPKSPEHRAKTGAGNRGKKRTLEQRARISLARKGKRHTAEWRMKMSAAETGEKNPFYGKHHTDENCMRFSEKNRGKTSYKNLLAELVAHQISYTKLAEILDLKRPTISDKMRGKLNFTPEQKERIKNFLGVEMSVEELFKQFDD